MPLSVHRLTLQNIPFAPRLSGSCIFISHLHLKYEASKISTQIHHPSTQYSWLSRGTYIAPVESVNSCNKTTLKMQRKEFLKRLGLGSLIVPLVAACGSEDADPTPSTDSTSSSSSSTTGTSSTSTTTSGTCTTSPSETAGPFPTKDPSSLVIQDIRSDRK
jgi:hypothetical protein